MSNNQLKYIIFAGLFLVPFVPLVVARSLFFPFITGKAFVFRFIVEIIFVSWLVLAIRDSEYRPKFSWILGAVIIFLFLIGVSDLFGANSFKSFWSNYERMEGFIALLHFGAFFMVLGSILKTQEIWNKLLATSVGASAIMAIYSFFQIIGKITINQGGVRVDGTFGNASYLGIYMVFHIFFAFLLLMRSRIVWHKWPLGIIGFSDLVVLYYTATRGAILGLLGGFFISFLYLAIIAERSDKIRKFALSALIGIIIFIGLFITLKNTDFVQKNLVLNRFSTFSLSEIRNQGRFYVWPMAWKGFLENPVLGWGQEGFNFVFNKHYNPKMYNQESWFDRTHDIVLDWLIAGGLLGLLSYISMFIALLFYIKKADNHFLPKEDKAVILGLISAYTFHNLFVFDQIGSYILFFTLLAYVHAHTSETRLSLWQKLSFKFRNLVEGERKKPIIEAILLIVFVFIFYFVIYVPWQVNKNLLGVLANANQGKVATLDFYMKPLSSYTIGYSEALEHISQTVIGLAGNPNVSEDLKKNLFNSINSSFERQLKTSPNDARYRLFYGLFLSRFGLYDKSIEELRKASFLSPQKQSIYFEIVNNLLAQGKKEEAQEIAGKAYELETTYDEAQMIYGLTLLSNGKLDLSSEILSKIPEIKLISDDRFISVLVQIGDFQKVIDIISLRIERDPNNTTHYMNLTAAYLQVNRRTEAISILEQIIKIDPSFKEKGEYFIKEIQAGRNP